MKILVIGAGALGGYYGSRLLQAGRDVTFLLRPPRIAQLKEMGGLHIKSTYGDLSISPVPCLTREQITTPFDLVIVSCKAYSLEGCMDAFAPAMGAQTLILPLLNGIEHIDKLTARFGKAHVLGGIALISATLDAQGQVLHLNNTHGLSFGPLDGKETPEVQAVKAALENAGFQNRYSANMMQEMWNKWVFIATGVGATCLFRAALCDIIKAGALYCIQDLLNECLGIARHNGFEPDETTLTWLHNTLTDPTSEMTASMLKDIEKGRDIEAQAIIGNLIARATALPQNSLPMLNLVYAHLQAYLARKERQAL